MSPRHAAQFDQPVSKLLWFLLALMILFWAANFVVAKHTVTEIPPLLTAGLRMILATVFILPIYIWEGRRVRAHRWSWSDLPAILGIGVIGIAGNQVMFLLGIKRTSVAHAAILFALAPVMVLLLATALKHERISLRKVTGIAIAAAGVLTLQLTGGQGGEASAAGDLLVVAGTAAFSLFTVFGRPCSARLGSIAVNTIGFAGCALALLPITLFEASRFDFGAVSSLGWAGLLYMAAFPSVVSYLIYYYSLTRMPASRLAALTYLEPPIATLLAVAVLGENITYSVLTGGGLVLAGVWFTERGR